MNHQIKSLPCRFICIDFQSLKINQMAMVTAFLLQPFQWLIQMLVLKIICPCGVQFHYFILPGIQNNMMIGMPFPGRVETIGFQNLYRPLRIILICHKKVNVRCLAKLRDRIKPGNGAALQCHRNDSLFRQKGGESCIQYLKLNSFMYCSGCFWLYGQTLGLWDPGWFPSIVKQWQNLVSVCKGQ